jgi:hypothetical protein
MPVAMLDKANSKCLNTNKELTTKVMRPSQTLNAIIDRLAGLKPDHVRRIAQPAFPVSHAFGSKMHDLPPDSLPE